ncbi:Peroxin 13, N-terminal region-domain-containing protein [Boletus coccyginus]|nr:Peroxin 13, N-terminal region-domain-containing protein [Boletus coccyginus]
MASPLKPWERASLPPTSTVQTKPPSLPARPEFLSPSYTTASPSYHNHSPYSPSRFGSTYPPYGSTLYGGGLGYGGMGGYGYSGYGTLETTTQHTFSLLHSIMQTFSGVAQMLESTFMATHSSFFAMCHLWNALGSVLGLFGLVRWMKELVTGKPSSSMQGEFREFINSRSVQGPHGPPAPKPSRKLLIIFFLAIFGVPYAMSKLIKILNERSQQQQQGQLGAQLGPINPSTLSFARALYPFTPSSPSELALKEGEIVLPRGWKWAPAGGRTRDGREGWFPRKWVEILAHRKPVGEPKKVD